MAVGDITRGWAPANLAGGMPHVQTTAGETVTLMTVEVPDKTCGIIETAVIGIQDGGDMAVHVAQHFVRRDGVAATYVNRVLGESSTDPSHIYENGIFTAAFTHDCTGTTYRCQVTGVGAAHTIEWGGSARWLVRFPYKA